MQLQRVFSHLMMERKALAGHEADMGDVEFKALLAAPTERPLLDGVPFTVVRFDPFAPELRSEKGMIAICGFEEYHAGKAHILWSDATVSLEDEW